MSDQGGASFGAPPPGGGGTSFQFPGSPGALVQNAGQIQSAVMLLIESWNANTTALINLLATLSGTITGDVAGTLPGPVQVVATHLAAPLPITQGGTGNASGQAAPVGAAGGDLGGTYPNPMVLATHLAAALPVAQGGTGIASGTSGGILAFTAAGAIGSSALLAQNQIILGGGAGIAPATLGGLGTATTLLHGNAAGAPSFGPVATADISNAAITYAKIQNVTDQRILGNTSGGAAPPSEIGVTGTGSVVLAVSPALTGTATAVNLNISGEEHLSPLDGITALVGGGRPGSPILSAQLNRIAVVASAADSAQLPAALAGDFRFVVNDGAHAAQIFANGTDTIDGVAGAVGVPLTNAKRAWFVCLTAGQWVSMSGGVSA